MRVDNSFKEVSFMGKKDESRCVPMWGRWKFLLFLGEERFKQAQCSWEGENKECEFETMRDGWDH